MIDINSWSSPDVEESLFFLLATEHFWERLLAEGSRVQSRFHHHLQNSGGNLSISLSRMCLCYNLAAQSGGPHGLPVRISQIDFFFLNHFHLHLSLHLLWSGTYRIKVYRPASSSCPSLHWNDCLYKWMIFTARLGLPVRICQIYFF